MSKTSLKTNLENIKHTNIVLHKMNFTLEYTKLENILRTQWFSSGFVI